MASGSRLRYLGPYPVPAGIILPIITFSGPNQEGYRYHEWLHQVGPRVVFPGRMLLTNELVSRDTLVIPIRTGQAVAGTPSDNHINIGICKVCPISISVPINRSVSPGSMTRTLQAFGDHYPQCALSDFYTWLR